MKEFDSLLQEFLQKIEVIDKNTPWQETEPFWWLKMSDLQRNIYNIRGELSAHYRPTGQ